MKYCANCNTLNPMARYYMRAWEPVIFCLNCGCAEFIAVGDELPFEDDEEE